MDGPQSIVMEQAKNRLHLQKGLMSGLVRANDARGRTPKARALVVGTK